MALNIDLLLIIATRSSPLTLMVHTLSAAAGNETIQEMGSYHHNLQNAVIHVRNPNLTEAFEGICLYDYLFNIANN